MQRVSVGKDVDSWCTRCKLMLTHTVEAMIGDKITRAHCNTCGAQHAYRPYPPGEQPGRVRSERPRTRAERAPHSGDYDTLLQGRDRAAALRYAGTERFRPGDLIAHASFGLGVVRNDKGDNKIDVLFSDGPRTLVHGRAALP